MTDHLDSETLSSLLDEDAADPSGGQAAGSRTGSREGAEEHLSVCTACAERHAALRGAAGALRSLTPPTLTAAEARDLRRAVLEAASPRRRGAELPGWRRLSRRVYVAAAAAVVILAGAGGYLYSTLAPSPSASTAAGTAKNTPMITAAPSHRAAAPAGATGGAPTANSQGPAPLDFATAGQVEAYVAAQVALAQKVLALDTAAAGSATKDFFDALGVVTATAASQTPPVASGLEPAPSPSGVNGANPGSLVAPALPESPQLSACAQSLLAAEPAAAVPIDVVTITYQGTPAWLVVFAVPASGSATLSAAGSNREDLVVASTSGCGVLDRATVTP